MPRIFFLVLFLGLSLSSFSQEINKTDAQGLKQGTWIKKYPNGNILYEGTFKDNKPTGTMKRYFESGELKAEMNFSDQGTTAQTTMYYQNGKVAAQGELVKGEKNGLWKYYSFYDDTLTAEEFYVNGKKEGEEKKYYPNGQVAELTQWKADKKHGPWQQFYENGQLKTESAFTEGDINGPYHVYTENGKPVVKGKYNMGRMDDTWYYYNEQGNIERELEFENGKPLNEEELTEQEKEFFELIEKNEGKYEEPSIEDFLQPNR